jgi:four helix bundle protein
MSDYRKLKVWHRTLDFIAGVYEITGRFPAHELYGLTSQIRRAATSIALNISEGATSGYDSEYARFLRLAIRSTNEVAAGFEIASRLNYCEAKVAQQRIAEADQIASMLQGLVKSFNRLSEEQEPYSAETDEIFVTDNQFND